MYQLYDNCSLSGLVWNSARKYKKNCSKYCSNTRKIKIRCRRVESSRVRYTSNCFKCMSAVSSPVKNCEDGVCRCCGLGAEMVNHVWREWGELEKHAMWTTSILRNWKCDIRLAKKLSGQRGPNGLVSNQCSLAQHCAVYGEGIHNFYRSDCEKRCALDIKPIQYNTIWVWKVGMGFNWLPLVKVAEYLTSPDLLPYTTHNSLVSQGGQAAAKCSKIFQIKEDLWWVLMEMSSGEEHPFSVSSNGVTIMITTTTTTTTITTTTTTTTTTKSCVLCMRWM